MYMNNQVRKKRILDKIEAGEFQDVYDVLNPFTIAVLQGGITVGCKKYRMLATAGPSPLIFF